MINEYILESKYFEEVDKGTIDNIVSLGSYSKELVYSSHAWSRSLRNYLIVTHAPGNIVVDKKITDENLLLNRYYWLKRFYHEYSKSLGIGAGVEQQIVSILETIGNNFASFDWNKIHEIDESIGSNE